jgi:hypothetical protein
VHRPLAARHLERHREPLDEPHVREHARAGRDAEWSARHAAGHRVDDLVPEDRRCPRRIEHLDLGEPRLRELGPPRADEAALLIGIAVQPDGDPWRRGDAERGRHLGHVRLAVAEQPLRVRSRLLAREVKVAARPREAAAEHAVERRPRGEVAGPGALDPDGGERGDGEGGHREPGARPRGRGPAPAGGRGGEAEEERGPGEGSRPEEEDAPVECEGLVVDGAWPHAQERVEEVGGRPTPGLGEGRRERREESAEVQRDARAGAPAGHEPSEHGERGRGEGGGYGHHGHEREAEGGAARREEGRAERRPEDERRLEQHGRAGRTPEGPQRGRRRTGELPARRPEAERRRRHDGEESRRHADLPTRGLEERQPGQPEAERGDEAGHPRPRGHARPSTTGQGRPRATMRR